MQRIDLNGSISISLHKRILAHERAKHAETLEDIKRAYKLCIDDLQKELNNLTNISDILNQLDVVKVIDCVKTINSPPIYLVEWTNGYRTWELERNIINSVPLSRYLKEQDDELSG